MVVIVFDTNVYQVKFANWTLCTRSCSLVSDITTQELTPLSYKILCYFILNPNRIISRDEFVSSVWSNHYVDDNAINKAISDLRRLLKDTDDSPNLIKTHYKKGYSFISEVEYVYEKANAASIPASISETISPETNEIELSPTLVQTDSASAEPTPKQLLLGKPKATSKLLNLKFLILFISILSASTGAIYWWEQQPQVLHLKSKKLSISDNSVYAFLSLSPANDKLAVSKLNTKNGVDEIFLIDLITHKNTKIISENIDSYHIGWASNSNSIYYQLINNEEQICEIWRADFLISNEVSNKEKILDCKSQYILSLVADETSNRIIYTKFGYRNVPSLSALVARDLTTGEEFQVTSPNIDSFGDRYLALSPNKDKIAFIRVQTGLRQIFIANLDGSMQKLLYETTESIRSISWNSEASKLSWYVPNSKRLISFDIVSKEIMSKTVNTDSYISTMLSGLNSLYGATRASDDDIFLYDTKDGVLNKLIDSRASEFMPIVVNEEFHFFQEGTPVKQFSYFDGKINKDEISVDLTTFNSGDYREQNGLLALSYDKELRLVDLEKKDLVEKFSMKYQISDLSWFNDESLLLILESKQSEQHVWLFNINTEELQKIIHKNAKSVSINTAGKIIYQDFYNNLYLFDPQEGLETQILSLSNFPYVIWKLYNDGVYYSTGDNLFKYSLETHEETGLIKKFEINEMLITDFDIADSPSGKKFILQIQGFKSNEVVFFELP